MYNHHCPHGYLYNIERDPCGPADRCASDGCSPPDLLVKRAQAYEAVSQAAYDLKCAVKKIGWHPGEPFDCAKALAARAAELVAILS